MKIELIKLISFVGLLYLAMGIAKILQASSKVLVTLPIPVNKEREIWNQKKFTENIKTGL